VIARRLQNARIEIGYWADYDYVLVNDDLQDTFRRLKRILRNERKRRQYNAEAGALVERLKADLDALGRSGSA
jgi:guanylate kinase